MQTSFVTQDERWNAVVGRLKAADGAFCYGVKTTGVYCRPSCASRLPNRVNVLFFADCDAAERAGYRACKRCKPKTALKNSQSAVAQACHLIEEATEPLALNDLANAIGLSPFHLHRIFKEAVGVTPKSYAQARRVQKLKDGLRQAGTVTKAIYHAGFVSSSRCYENAESALGMTPATYKKGAAGVTIRSAIVECYLGLMLVAATEKGVCLIAFGDHRADLRAQLRDLFPKAVIIDADMEFAAWIAQVSQLLETPSRAFDLPLDVQCTAFQQRVWQELQAIPPGATATYAEVAKKIGRPTAVRAVARACASNPVAVVIPCHRVVGSDGKLTGYRWGVERKRKLIEREAGLDESGE